VSSESERMRLEHKARNYEDAVWQWIADRLARDVGDTRAWLCYLDEQVAEARQLRKRVKELEDSG
jgi:hypothetical protein